jgi:hypothetical protein
MVWWRWIAGRKATQFFFRYQIIIIWIESKWSVTTEKKMVPNERKRWNGVFVVCAIFVIFKNSQLDTWKKKLHYSLTKMPCVESTTQEANDVLKYKYWCHLKLETVREHLENTAKATRVTLFRVTSADSKTLIFGKQDKWNIRNKNVRTT